jgi:hypothetical protein
MACQGTVYPDEGTGDLVTRLGKVGVLGAERDTARGQDSGDDAAATAREPAPA